jgi:non-heme chloroperoxidase
LKKIDIPVLLLHLKSDQIVPIKVAALQSIKLFKEGTLKIYPGGAHALPNTATDDVNKDLLAFLESCSWLSSGTFRLCLGCVSTNILI